MRAADERDSRRRVAILAEDDHDIQWALTEALIDAGFDVIAVADAERLRDVLSERRADVLVADYHLIGDTSEAVVVDAVERAVVPRVVVVSASAEARFLAERLAIAHVAKPFELDHLIAVVSDESRNTAA